MSDRLADRLTPESITASGRNRIASAIAQGAPSPPASPPAAPLPASLASAPNTTGSRKFDLEAFIAAHLNVKRGPIPWDTRGRKWELEVCPFDPDHTGGVAVVTEGHDGKTGFKCQRNHCINRHWKDVRELYDGPREKRSSGAQTSKVQPPEFQDGRSVYECEDPPLVAVVEDLIFPGFTLLTGRPKSGKSWFALQMALAVARGEMLAGWLDVPRAGKVLYLALEEPRQRTTARMRKLRRDGDSIEALENIHFVYKILPMMGGGAAELDASLCEWPAELVVIDTVRSFSRLRTRSDSNAVQIDYDVSSLIRELAEKHKTAIVGIDHTRKMPGDIIDAVIGTTGTTAGCDAVCGMTRTFNGDTVLTARGREHEEVSYALRFKNAPGSFGWEVYGSGEDARISEEREEIVELLRHEAPLKPAKVAMMLKKNANTVRRLLSKMAADGRVLKQSGGYVLAGKREQRDQRE